ncbi:MAG: hypothetical protein V8T51_03505 [Senegalimassilia faecalis]
MTEVIRMFDRACDNQAGKLFDELATSEQDEADASFASPCPEDVVVTPEWFEEMTLEDLEIFGDSWPA